MYLKESPFGRTSTGQEVKLYTLVNKKGMEIAVSNLGASLVRVLVKDSMGRMRDVVLGYDSAGEYEKGRSFFGATVGRCANRIGGASFSLGGKEYVLEKNDNGNNLHSGTDFYYTRVWETMERTPDSVTFCLHSPDGDQGYPGAVDIAVTYRLTRDNAVEISYRAVPDADTILNLTNHSYFNLDGHQAPDVLAQKIWIDADAFTRADGASIPTGEIVPVEGTPMDFRVEKAVGQDIEEPYEALLLGNGYDHNWVLRNEGTFAKIASLSSDASGIRMDVYTDLPGMQLYTANFVEDERGKDGAVYGRRSGVCFETQYFPDAVHQEGFASPVCKAGAVFQTKTAYQFLVK